MAVSIPPVGPDIPAELQPILQAMSDAIGQLQQPGAPSVLLVIDTAANLLLTAPAADYPGGFAQITDKAAIAHSVETAPGTWTWVRADGSAL